MSEIKLVGFCGPKRAGKNFAGNALTEDGWIKHEMSALIRSVMEHCLDEKMTDDFYERTKDQLLYADRTFRDFYVGIGQSLRNLVDTDVHLNYFTKFVKQNLDKNVYTPNVRFDNEAVAIREMGGIIIEIDRPWHYYDSSDPTETRISESLIDYVVHNTMDAAMLHESIRSIVYATK